ncbi:MAG: Na+/H+ antiporter subunit E [Alphaproteobacteria bacterium]|nr:Na+/H+ antiporter subunit E [Alphaproteobacteria bacterium]
MNLFLLNLVLALVWGAVTSSFAPGNLLFGFILGFISLWLVRDRFNLHNFYRPLRIIRLLAVFLKELVISGYRVARDTLSPSMNFKPAIIALPLDVKQDAEIMLLANMISLTPGTLSVDVSSDRSTLYIHAMNVDDPEELCREIKDGFERLVIEAME